MLSVALGADHAGWELKETLKAWLMDAGYHVLDFGTHGPDSVDYPDYALQVAEAVTVGKVERGVLICGTGIGMTIAANKVSGIRAVTCRDPIEAEMSRRHNDANVLCMSADFLGQELIDRMVQVWLTTDFEGGRHQRRVEKISKYESESRVEA